MGLPGHYLAPAAHKVHRGCDRIMSRNTKARNEMVREIKLSRKLEGKFGTVVTSEGRHGDRQAAACGGDVAVLVSSGLLGVDYVFIP